MFQAICLLFINLYVDLIFSHKLSMTLNYQNSVQANLMLNNYELISYRNSSETNSTNSFYTLKSSLDFNNVQFYKKANKTILNNLFTFFIRSHHAWINCIGDNFKAEFSCEVDATINGYYFLEVKNESVLNISLLHFNLIDEEYSFEMNVSRDLIVTLQYYVQRFCVKHLADLNNIITFKENFRPPSVYIQKQGSNLTCVAEFYKPLGLDIQWQLSNELIPDDLTEERLIKTKFKEETLYSYFKTITTSSINYQCVVFHRRLNYNATLFYLNSSKTVELILFENVNLMKSFTRFWLLVLIPIIVILFYFLSFKNRFCSNCFSFTYKFITTGLNRIYNKNFNVRSQSTSGFENRLFKIKTVEPESLSVNSSEIQFNCQLHVLE
ncbi:U20 protein [macacine betaherpesvirus 9]|uniref:U20 protein n=1 Tax=macacine betaherpesvirus 9 TaxID=2560568 RepID=A0A191S3U1_9BETA|nr:U20 protein [macacine betaherpesvirus 9]ANC96555.1 U20 protein [macacine betaherpesvirus 9]